MKLDLAKGLGLSSCTGLTFGLFKIFILCLIFIIPASHQGGKKNQNPVFKIYK